LILIKSNLYSDLDLADYTNIFTFDPPRWLSQ